MDFDNTSATDSFPTNCFCEISFDEDGQIYTATPNGGVGAVQNWVTPIAAASGLFEVLFTLNSGSLAAGTVGTWLTLDSVRAVSVSAAAPGSQSANVTAEVRYNGGPPLDSATLTLLADAF